MNSAKANLPGIHIATFGYGGMQRSTGCVAAISCHRVGSGSEGQTGLLSRSAGLIENFVVQHDEGASGPRQVLPGPPSRRD